MATTIIPAKKQQQRGLLNDTTMLEQVQATHKPDGSKIDVKPLIHIIEDIFSHATSITPSSSQGAHSEASDDTALQAGYEESVKLLGGTINKISCEITCKCSSTSTGDTHATTLSIFNLVSSYPWEAKVVLTLAAFAMYYGELWLVAQIYSENIVAKSVAVLKQLPLLPEIVEHADSFKLFEEISNLIRAMVHVTKCIVEFNELPPQYITADTPAYKRADNLIPIAEYYVIQSIIACSSQIAGLLSMSHEYKSPTTEALELSSLSHKVNNIYEHLKMQLDLCYEHIGEKKHIEAYHVLVRTFETTHVDNMKIIKILINPKDDQLPLFDGSRKKRVSVDVLKKKNVLLLISDLDISKDELVVLKQMYQESRQHSSRPESQYELVWLLVTDTSTHWTEEIEKQFQTLQSMMPWHTPYHPSMLDRVVIRYIKEVWQFNKKPILVVLDQRGRVTNHNALHMMLIWGSLAFPFTSDREECLWKEGTWWLDLLAKTIEPRFSQWIKEGRYICLYGGEDMAWIKEFTIKLSDIAQVVGIQLEMLYVGKSNLTEKVRKNTAEITQLGQSHVHVPKEKDVWSFWVRLESMWHSKIQRGSKVEDDWIMKEIMTMMSFDGSDQGWALICKGSTEMTRAKGDTLLKCLDNYKEWKDDVKKGFVQAFGTYLHKIQPQHHYNRLILPNTTGNIPKKVVCVDCGRTMEKFIMYRCCTD